MNETEITESFQLVREHTHPIAIPLLDSLERLYQIDRALLAAQKLKVAMVEGVVGHRVYDDNDQHSRRATDIKAVQ